MLPIAATHPAVHIILHVERQERVTTQAGTFGLFAEDVWIKQKVKTQTILGTQSRREPTATSQRQGQP